MSEPKIGRLLVASLHQAIAELLPLKLEFYENWLKPLGLLKEGRVIGVASFSAALSFLRREEPPDTYHAVTRRAGELAAVWTYDAQSWSRRRWLGLLPTRMRLRGGLRLARDITHSAYPGSKSVIRLHRNGGHVEVRGSIFCQVREQVDRPLCGFYEGVIVQLMERLAINGRARLSGCRAAGAPACQIQVTWRKGPPTAGVPEDRHEEQHASAAEAEAHDDAETPAARPRRGVLTE
jgi:predicted hydrocarbon binding protein